MVMEAGANNMSEPLTPEERRNVERKKKESIEWLRAHGGASVGKKSPYETREEHSHPSRYVR